MSQLDVALSLAVRYHSGQKDKQDQPYIFHILRVIVGTKRPDAQIVAALHDILEDTPCPLSTLLVNFPAHIVEAVQIISRNSESSYEDYIQLVSTNSLATEVKISDLHDNISRMDGLPLTEQNRLLPRYKKALEVLGG